MIEAYSVAATRAMEEAVFATTDPKLVMQRAAHGLSVAVADELRRLRGGVYGSHVVLLIGPGNNGGDALFAGARLRRRGAAVTAVSVLGTPHAGGLAELRRWGGVAVELDAAELVMSHRDVHLVVDGILGIGGRPGLPDAVSELVSQLRRRGATFVAVDLPSGVDADTGGVGPAAVHAARTVTFGTRKPCHVLDPARSRCGAVSVVDIGLDPTTQPAGLQAWESEDVALHWPYPDEYSDKYSRGVVGIDAGSEQYPGAGILSTFGAVHAGAGMVRFLGAESARPFIATSLPNVVFAGGRVQAHLLGSGWGERDDGAELVAAAVNSGQPAVIDADGLRYLPDQVPASCVLTPHAGELARLLSVDRAEVESDPVTATRRAAERTGATVLLKGATQLAAAPGQSEVLVAVSGPAWTGQAGSGDVLAGICATLLAAGLDTVTAGVMAASVQAMAARSLPGPVPPQELARHCAVVIGQLSRLSRSGR